MEDVIIIRRKAKKNNCLTYNNPIIKMELPRGRFLISKNLANTIGVAEDDGLMFAFNKKNGNAYVFKDAEPDAYILRRKDNHSFRFTAKELQDFFISTFCLDISQKVFYFYVEGTADDRGYYRIKLYI